MFTMHDDEKRSLDSVLESLSRHTIVNNLHRKGNKFTYFNEDEVLVMNNYLKLGGVEQITGGYSFLDKPNGSMGMIRLYVGQCNFKWSFEQTDDIIEVYPC